MIVSALRGEHVSYFVAGLPETKGSWTPLPGGKMKNDNPREAAWRTTVGWAARIAMRGRKVLDGALVTMDFYLPPPVGRKNQRDVDKLCRSILDAMTDIVYVDDENVRAIVASKEIAAGAARGSQPDGVEVHVFPPLQVRASQLMAAWIESTLARSA